MVRQLSYPNIQILYPSQLEGAEFPHLIGFVSPKKSRGYAPEQAFLLILNQTLSFIPIFKCQCIFFAHSNFSPCSQNIENKLTSHFGRFQVTKHNGFAILHLVLRNKFDQATNNGPGFKHKEAFSTLVESLVQMTCSDFTIFFKLAEFAAFCYGKK